MTLASQFLADSDKKWGAAGAVLPLTILWTGRNFTHPEGGVFGFGETQRVGSLGQVVTVRKSEIAEKVMEVVFCQPQKNESWPGYLPGVSMVVGRDAVRNRLYSDDEIIAMRAAWATSDLAPSTFAKEWTGSRTHWAAVYKIIEGRSYQWLLPGHPYRIEYDRQKAAAAAAAAATSSEET